MAATPPSAPNVPSQKAVSVPNATNQPVVNPTKPDFSQDALTPQANKTGLTAQQLSQQAKPSVPPGTPPPQAQAPTQAQTIAQSQAAPGTTAIGARTGTIPAGQGNTPQTTTFQAQTTGAYDTSKYTSYQQSLDAQAFLKLQSDRATNDAQAAYAKSQQNNTQAGQSVTGYTDTNGVYHPPTTTVANQPLPNPVPAPKAQTNLVTPDLTHLVTSASTPSGVISTDQSDVAKSAVGATLDQIKASALANIPQVADPVTQSYIDHNLQEAQRLQSYINDPSLDPQQQALAAQAAELATEKAETEGNIQIKAQKAYDDQQVTNKEILGKMRVAMATGGVTGSPLGVSILAGVYQSNQRALNDIRSSEADAISQAESAYRKDNLQLAVEKMQLVDTRHQQYNDLQDKQFQISTQIKQQQQQDQAFALQMSDHYRQLQKENKADTQDAFASFAKAGAAWEAIPQSAKDEATGVYGSENAAKLVYQGSMKDEQAKSASQFNANTDAFYKAAQALPPNSNQTLYRPNPDGTFTSVTRSSVQTNPNYDTFQTTKNGKNYVEYVDKNDPSNRKEVPLGDVDPKITYKDNPFGGTDALIEHGDGTIDVKHVLDFAGNPMGSVAVTDTTSHLSSSGNTFVQSSGSPTWTQQYPDGSVYHVGGVAKPECGQFCNYVLGTHFGDSLQDKISKTDKTIGTSANPVKAGDAIVTAEAVGTGHVAIINSIGSDDKGEYYILSESNYKKNNQGQGIVTNDRKIYANNPLVKGYARGTKDPAGDTTDKPKLPEDNKMSWTVNAPVGSALSTAVKNGTVQDIQEVGAYKDGSPMYMASVKDNETGTITNYSGIKSSELRIGSSWSSSTKSPSIGNVGHNGYVVDLRNGDGSPIQPNGNAATPLSERVSKGETWGTYNFIPSAPAVQSRFNAIMGQVSKGAISLDSALSRMKTDPILGQITPDTYLGDFQDAANQAKTQKNYKDLQTQNLEETIKQKEIRGARTVVPVAILQGDPRIQNYRQTQANMPRIDNLTKTYAAQDWVGSAPTDLELVDTYVSMAKGGGQINETQVAALKDYQSKADAIRNTPNLWSTGGFLNPNERKEIVNLANGLKDEQKTTFDQAMGEYQQMITDNGYTLKLTPQNINQVMGSVIDPRTGKETPIDQTNMGAADQFGTTMNPDGTFNVPDNLQ